MQMVPCETCDETDFDPDSSVLNIDGELASRYEGACPRCGTRRAFMFRLPEEILFPDDEEPQFGGEEPSELLDPGDWMWLADMFAGDAPASPDGLDPEQRHGVLVDLRMAAAAIGEVGKFLPEGADAVPPSAFFSERGRAMYAREPGRFVRGRLDVVQRTYRAISDRFATDGSPAGEPVIIGAEPAAATAPREDEDGRGAAGDHTVRGRARLPYARTYNEVYLYLDLRPCVCGDTDLDERVISDVVVDGRPAERLSGHCSSCGRSRQLTFEMPDGPPPDLSFAVRYGYGEEPSRLIDCGEWIGAAELYGMAADELERLADPADDTALTRRYYLLTSALACLDEVIKFLPDGAVVVPETAFWSDAGREVHTRVPERFTRHRLTAERETLHAKVADFERAYTDDDTPHG